MKLRIDRKCNGASMPRKNASGLSSIKSYKPRKAPTLADLQRRDKNLPPWARQPVDPELQRCISTAIANCHCLEITYPDDDDREARRLFCPSAMGTKHGRMKATGMQLKQGEASPRDLAIFVAGLTSAEPSDAEWLPDRGDLARSTQFDPGKIVEFSQCPGDPDREHLRPV